MQTDDGLGYLYPNSITTTTWTLYAALSAFTAGVSAGTSYTGGTAPVDLFGPVGTREHSDPHADRLGEEYRINPDLSIDTGAPDDGLFVTDPQVLIDAKPGGSFGSIRRINGSATSVSIDCSQVTSLVYAYGAGGFEYTSLSEPTVARAIDGDPWSRQRAIDLPGATGTDADAAAQNTLNLFQYPRSSFGVQSSDRYVRRFVQPGDSIYVYFPDAGIKSDNRLDVGAQVVFPQIVRVHEIEWGVHEGHGVFLRRHDGVSETWLPLTRYVQFSDSSSSWKVGTARGLLDAAALKGATRLGSSEVPPPPPAVLPAPSTGFSINGPATVSAPAVRGVEPAAPTPYAPATRGVTPASYTTARRG